MPSGLFRNVCFTLFNVENEPPFQAEKCSYLVYGRETCPSTGRVHYQGYCELKKQTSLRQLKSIFGDGHFERRNGTALEAASYCKKDSNWKEFGKISCQGSRSDLAGVAERIVSGASTIADVIRTSPGLFVQYHRGLENLAARTNQSRTGGFRKVMVFIYWGATGTGKTRTWFERYGINDQGYRYQYSNNNQWWDGYNGQKHILFDEFSGQIPLSTMLQWLDGYPCRLEVKGSFTYAAWDTVHIISNDNPQTYYQNAITEKRKAFARRIHSVTHFVSENEKIEKNGFCFEQENTLIG